MPLVFASSEATASGHSYDDRTGVSYEYPSRYRKLIQEGESFVYYRGRRKAGGGIQPQVYFGMGTVGLIREDAKDPHHLQCAIVNYVQFPTPVPFRAEDGSPLEASGDRRGYYQPGVRRITDEEFNEIVGRGLPDRSGTTIKS